MRNNNMNKEAKNLHDACLAYGRALALVEEVNEMCENFDEMPVGKEFRCKDLCPDNYQRAAAYLNMAAWGQRYANKDFGVEDRREKRVARMTASLPADVRSAEDLKAYLADGGDIRFTPIMTEVHVFKKTR